MNAPRLVLVQLRAALCIRGQLCLPGAQVRLSADLAETLALKGRARVMHAFGT